MLLDVYLAVPERYRLYENRIESDKLWWHKRNTWVCVEYRERDNSVNVELVRDGFAKFTWGCFLGYSKLGEELLETLEKAFG